MHVNLRARIRALYVDPGVSHRDHRCGMAAAAKLQFGEHFGNQRWCLCFSFLQVHMHGFFSLNGSRNHGLNKVIVV